MKIQLVKNPIPAGYSWQPPKQVEVPHALGMQLIEDGYAIHIEDDLQDSKPVKPARKPKPSKGTPKGNS